LPQFEHRIRCARAASVTDLPAIRASASGSMWRDAPHGQVTHEEVAETVIKPLDMGQYAHWVHGADNHA